MKHIKSINEFYDDYNKASDPISKKELSDIVNKKIYTSPSKKPVLDVPFEMTDNLYKDTRILGSKMSELYIFEQKLLKELPFLRTFKFQQTERKESNDYFNIEYRFSKKVDNVGLFTVELHIFGGFDKFTVMFTPFIERREDTSTTEFSILREEDSDLIFNWLSDLKRKGFNDEQALKEMENYITDFKDGDIVSYEDSDFIKPLSVIKFGTNKHNFVPNITNKINNNFKTYTDYISSVFNIDII